MIKIEGVTKKFGSTMAVNQCTLEFETGRIYGLLGPNGSGKSTLMKMIAGLFKPSKGDIFVDGDSISYLSKAKVAYMSTEGFMYPYMTIETVGSYFQDFYTDFDLEKYNVLLTAMDLKPELKVGNLSSGMNVKLQLAATLARNARVIMLDEPLNGIDLIARDQIINAIIENANETNLMIISSHLVDQMEPILDDVIFIKEGVVVTYGEAELLRVEKNKSIVDLYKEVFSC
jgi:ABC-2 type transport system ATP-binding protein